jgi:O-antigen/teichoic acid export membrane protein
MANPAPGVRARIVRNTFWYGVVTVVGLVAGLVMSVVLARGLGPARMGDYSYLLWAGRVLEVLALLGFAVGTVRYTAEALGRGDAVQAWGFVRLFLHRQALTTTVVVGLALPVILALAPGDLRWPFVVLAVGLFPATLEVIYTNALYGAHRYDLTAATSTLKMALQLVLAVAILRSGGGILEIVAASAGVSVLTLAIQRHHARRLYPADVRATVPADVQGELTRFLVSLATVRILDALVWDRSEVFFLRLYTSSEAIAFYSLAFGLTTKAMLLPEIAIGGLLPGLAALHGRGDREEMARVYRSAVRYVALAGAPIAAIGAALAPAVVTILYGPAYLPAAPLFQMLAAVAVLNALRKVAWVALSATGDAGWIARAMSVSAVVNVAAAALAIPAWGTTGAVAANTAAQLVASVGAFMVLARRRGYRFPLRDVLKIAAAAVLAFGAAWVLLPADGGFDGLVLAALGGGTAFVAACLVSGAAGPRDWALVLTVTRRLGAARASRA